MSIQLSPERIEALLIAHDDAGSFLERPPEPLLLAGQNRETAAARDGPATEGGPTGAAPATPPLELFGDFGAYRITGIIGQGGMGMVFLGHEARLHRTVAIKVLNPALASVPAARERFLREARVAAAEGVRLPGAMRFEIRMNPRGVQETVSCFATERDVLAELPGGLGAADFDPLPVATLEQLRSGFVSVTGGTLGQEVFHVQPK